MLVQATHRDQAKELEPFHIECPVPSSMPAILGARLMDLLLQNIPSRLVPDLKQAPKARGF